MLSHRHFSNVSPGWWLPPHGVSCQGALPGDIYLLNPSGCGAERRGLERPVSSLEAPSLRERGPDDQRAPFSLHPAPPGYQSPICWAPCQIPPSSYFLLTAEVS